MQKPTTPYFLASFACLVVGSGGFLLGLDNATTLTMSEQGYYLTLLAFGLYAAVSIQKNARDREEGQAVSKAFVLMSYLAGLMSLVLLVVGLINANLAMSEKGYYGLSFLLALFSAITVQKNIRDDKAVPNQISVL